jgi:protein-disulfide isomerase
MTTHITGLLLAILVIWRAIKEFGKGSRDILQTSQTKVKSDSHATPMHIIRPLRVISLALIGLVLAGLMVIYQINLNPSAVYRDGKSLDKMPAIDYHAIPMMGSPDAPYIVTLLFDYQCPHCQKLHFILNEVIRRYNGKLAFALCPAPLNNACNPYIPPDGDAFKNSCELARIGMAVWVASREAFPVFENWMFTFESGDRWYPRSLETAKAKAVELIGQEKLDAAWADPWIGKYIQTCIRIYGQTIQSGKGGVPKLIFGSHWATPEIYSVDDLVLILQKSLVVPKP